MRTSPYTILAPSLCQTCAAKAHACQFCHHRAEINAPKPKRRTPKRRAPKRPAERVLCRAHMAPTETRVCQGFVQFAAWLLNGLLWLPLPTDGFGCACSVCCVLCQALNRFNCALCHEDFSVSAVLLPAAHSQSLAPHTHSIGARNRRTCTRSRLRPTLYCSRPSARLAPLHTTSASSACVRRLVSPGHPPRHRPPGPRLPPLPLPQLQLQLQSQPQHQPQLQRQAQSQLLPCVSCVTNTCSRQKRWCADMHTSNRFYVLNLTNIIMCVCCCSSRGPTLSSVTAAIRGSRYALQPQSSCVPFRHSLCPTHSLSEQQHNSRQWSRSARHPTRCCSPACVCPVPPPSTSASSATRTLGTPQLLALQP